MTQRDDIDELDLLALADGVLDDDPVRKAQVEAAAAASPQDAARLADYRAQTAALRAAYAGALSEPVPQRIQAVLDTAGHDRIGPGLRRVAAGLLVVAAGCGGWLLGQGGEDPTGQALLDESYRQFTLFGSDRLVSTTAASVTGSPPSIAWGQEDVAIRLSAPDLSSEGFTLIEKRALHDGEQQVVALEYAAGDGRAFSLFIAPRWADRAGPIVEQEREGVTLAYWHDGPLASSVATRLPREEARQIVRKVRSAMRDDTTAPPAALEPEYQSGGDPGTGMMADTLEPGLDTGATGNLATPLQADIRQN